MTERVAAYRVVELSPARRVMRTMLALSAPQHLMVGLLEVDVTAPRRLIAEHKARCGETLSFTGYLTFCLARAVDEDRSVQAYLKGGKRIVVFEDVDVGLMVERGSGEKRALGGYVVRGANRKSCRAIHEEMRAAQAAPPEERGMPGWFMRAMLLPWPLSALVNALIRAAARRNPTIFTSLAGTVGISAVGMFGAGRSGWGVASAQHSLSLIVGGIAWKPGVVEGRIEPRELLALTVVFDHDVIDGAPAARFTRRLVELIESGAGLAAEADAMEMKENHR